MFILDMIFLNSRLRETSAKVSENEIGFDKFKQRKRKEKKHILVHEQDKMSLIQVVQPFLYIG